jgi:hypothetical protein
LEYELGFERGGFKNKKVQARLDNNFDKEEQCYYQKSNFIFFDFY